MFNNYEAVFILTPVLSDPQVKDTVEKFKKVLTGLGSEMVNEELMGLKTLAYKVQGKTTGFYVMFEFKADPAAIKPFETEFRRDERVLRFMTTKLDKYAVAYNEKRRSGAFNKKKELVTEEATA